jgi:hypothetical protein
MNSKLTNEFNKLPEKSKDYQEVYQRLYNLSSLPQPFAQDSEVFLVFTGSTNLPLDYNQYKIDIIRNDHLLILSIKKLAYDEKDPLYKQLQKLQYLLKQNPDSKIISDLRFYLSGFLNFFLTKEELQAFNKSFFSIKEPQERFKILHTYYDNNKHYFDKVYTTDYDIRQIIYDIQKYTPYIGYSLKPINTFRMNKSFKNFINHNVTKKDIEVLMKKTFKKHYKALDILMEYSRIPKSESLTNSLIVTLKSSITPYPDGKTTPFSKLKQSHQTIVSQYIQVMGTKIPYTVLSCNVPIIIIKQHFNSDGNLVVNIKKKNNSVFTLKEVRELYDSVLVGADMWAEGDITIIDIHKCQKLKMTECVNQDQYIDVFWKLESIQAKKIELY